MGDAIVGVVANPLSGRDIRRLVTQASVFPTAEKANMIQRMLEPHGVTARLAADAPRQVLAPIAPGLVVPVGVHEIEPMHPGSVHLVDARAGVIAVDGERELTFGPGERPDVRLRPDGPRCVDIPAVLAASARLGLLRRTLLPPGSTV
jgi:hypothetical protein